MNAAKQHTQCRNFPQDYQWVSKQLDTGKIFSYVNRVTIFNYFALFAVAIATVLAMSPDILVMDEPTSGLDPRARRRLIEMLQTFKHSKIIATHDLDMVLDLCERTIIRNEGRVHADGKTADIFQDEKLLNDCHLDKPLRLQGCPVCR